jgi:hypothetical protein
MAVLLLTQHRRTGLVTVLLAHTAQTHRTTDSVAAHKAQTHRTTGSVAAHTTETHTITDSVAGPHSADAQNY